MKVSYDPETKKTDVEADVEKLVEKGMNQHEKNWKEKFATKHNAKKEMLEIKHKQKMDLEENEKTKKNWLQKIEEEKRKKKELELAEQRRLKELELEEMKLQEAKEQKSLILKIVISIVFALIGICFFVAGSIIDPGLNVIGLILFVAVIYIWLNHISKDKERKKY